MTGKEAKEISLEKWRYLRDHIRVGRLWELSLALFNKFEQFMSGCPLCTLFNPPRCRGCPLDMAGQNCFSENSVYQKWTGDIDVETSQEAAAEIVRIIEAWDTV
jgi:hypothetical protein